uniref:serpin B3-like n=1 Tax=Styela clava TaxID=7725 RepID=UPI001939F2D0|nr:serpin B3-like [Styela clava]
MKLYFVLYAFFIYQFKTTSAKDAFKCRAEHSSEANIKFSVSLLQNVLQREKGGSNVMISPLAVGSGLSTLLVGSKGITRRQIIRGLKLDQSPEYSMARTPCFLQVYNNKAFQPSKKSVRLKKANFEPTILTKATKLYADKRLKYRKAFIRKSAFYGAGLERIDFRSSPYKARKKINSWVSEQTSTKIKDFMQPGMISKNTNLALVTTVYFKAAWETVFMDYDTRQGIFYKPNRKTVSIQFMENLSFYRTLKLKNPEADILELPYKTLAESGLETSMILIMPSKRYNNMNTFISQMSERQKNGLNGIFDQILTRRKTYYDVIIPKFNVTADHDLKGALKGMGVKNLFYRYNADLSNMYFKGKRPFSLDTAIHKTVMSVNERGTEVAGVTGFRFGLIVEPPVMRFNRPFLLVILEKSTKSILFIGRISDPSLQ